MNCLTIVGGGLAGLALGILLRERDVPVRVVEAGQYPRHRVCGEFISGKGAEILATLLPRPVLQRHGAHAHDAAFFSAEERAFSRMLPELALAVSRFTLDFALAEHFQLLGGELRVGERASPPAAPGTVWASGRRARAAHGDWRWFGLKIHARNVALDADLEMHLAPNAYVGLCRLADGEVNVCGLFRRAARSNTDSPEGVPARAPYVKGQKRHGVSLATAPTPAVTSIEWLRGAPGSPLARKLERADLDYDSLCAVAGLSLAPEAVDPAQCRIGDALTMIPPITGNGMSMAFESAEIACGPLTEYARGAWSWSEASAEIATQLQTAFARRLRWASVLHRLLFSPTGRAAMPLVARSNAFWRATFNATR